ncbi:MAG TPA: hypothetical protein VGB83_02885 [Actinomycetota bacterium]
MRRRFAVDAAGLSVGAAVNGIAAYGFAAIGSRALGAAGFAPVSVLWTFWAVAGAALAFPIQHWVIRRVHADGSEAGVRRALPRMTMWTAMLALACGFVAWIERADLFRSQTVLFPSLLALIVLGTAAMGVLRGGLAARGRFSATAAAFAAESLVRLGLAVIGAAAGWGPEAFALVMVAGFGVVLVWPSALRFGGGRAEEGHQLGFLAGISAGSLLSQLVLTGAPVAMALAGAGAAGITSAFAALALFRAPYLLALGVTSRMTGALTGFVVGHRRARLRATLALTVGGALLAGGAGALAGATIALGVLRILFGPEIDLPRNALVFLGAGSGVALGTLVQGLVLISRARWQSLVAVWGVALAAGSGWMVVAGGDVAVRAALAFLMAEGIALIAMTALESAALRAPAASAAARA